MSQETKERRDRNSQRSCQNISSIPYGCFEGSNGTAHLNFHFDERICPLGAGKEGANPPYTITYDPEVRDSMYVKIKKIPPKRILCIEVAIQIASNAYLSKECAIQVDLYYKKKLIRYRQEVIQPSFQPSYDPQAPPADVLLVISKDFTTTEFQFWEHIFDLLGVSADYWDIHKHNGFSVDLKTGVRHKDSWIGRYSGKLVLYPHGVLKLLHAKDIAIHFHGEDISTTQLQDLGSSMVVFGAKKITYQEKKNLVKQLALTTPKITLPIPDIHRSHLCQPSTAIYSATRVYCMGVKLHKRRRE